jgi:hypothetical protein
MSTALEALSDETQVRPTPPDGEVVAELLPGVHRLPLVITPEEQQTLLSFLAQVANKAS